MIVVFVSLVDGPLLILPGRVTKSVEPQGLWNYGFFTLDNGLQEKIVAGREDIWIEGFGDAVANGRSPATARHFA